MEKLKKMRKDVRIRRGIRLLLNLSIIAGVIGFILMIGAVGGMECETLNFRDGTLLAITGVALMTGCMFGCKCLYNWKELLEEREWNAYLDLTEDDVIGFMTYMKDCDCWAVVVNYRDETHWKFCLCLDNGRPISVPIRAESRFSDYNWTKM